MIFYHFWLNHVLWQLDFPEYWRKIQIWEVLDNRFWTGQVTLDNAKKFIVHYCIKDFFLLDIRLPMKEFACIILKRLPNFLPIAFSYAYVATILLANPLYFLIFVMIILGNFTGFWNITTASSMVITTVIKQEPGNIFYGYVSIWNEWCSIKRELFLPTVKMVSVNVFKVIISFYFLIG